MNKSERGQGLVELSLVIIIFMILMAGFADVAPLAADLYFAKQMSARGARAASIYLADGSERTCFVDVMNAIGDPGLYSAEWTATINGPCTNDPGGTIPIGTSITVTIDVDYSPLFLGGFGWPAKDTSDSWVLSISTTDQAR